MALFLGRREANELEDAVGHALATVIAAGLGSLVCLRIVVAGTH